MSTEPVDAVYTWVDDSFDGYRELLSLHAGRPVDRNPNRTRDNVDALRYSLRSVHRYAPWFRTIHIVTMRPQVPAWLEAAHPQLRIVHHDDIFDAAHLPTFNSFAIVANLHRVPGLAERFVYFEDDKFLLQPVRPGDFHTAEGRPIIYTEPRRSDHGEHTIRQHPSPWSACVAWANHLLDREYGPQARAAVKYAPLAMTRSGWDVVNERFGAELERTCATKFRTPGTAAPEFLYPWALIAEDLADAVPPARTAPSVGYHGASNLLPHNWWALRRLIRRRPPFININDNFGQRPLPRAVAQVTRFFDVLFPDASPLERVAGQGLTPEAGHDTAGQLA